MAVTVCPWCQNEIPHEEGTEPEKWCPVCENELDGYRTLRVGIGDSDEEDAEDEAADAAIAASGREDLSWMDDGELTEKDEGLLRFEETVEGLLGGQDAVPECPQCREYMLEAGERTVTAESFRPRVPEPRREGLLAVPFSLTMYVCPSCFAVQHTLAEQSRADLARRLSGEDSARGKGSKR